MPIFTKNQRVPADTDDFEMIKKNVDKVQSRFYISEGIVLSLTDFFYVKKGDYDIRVVYDLTALGLNDAFCAPAFWIPLVGNVLDIATHLS